MKGKKTIFKFLAMLLLGAAIGFVLGYVSELVDINGVEDAALSIKAFVIDYGIWFQVVLGLIFLGPAFVLTRQGVSITKSKAFSEDEGQLEEKADKKLNIAILWGHLHFIASIPLFAVITDETNDFVLISALIFLLGVGIYSFLQVWVINVVKSIDSLKEGSPSSYKFQRQWMSSLDEGEKFKVYEAGYKTFSFSSGMMLIVLMGSFLSKIFFNTSVLTVFLIGFMWSLQIIVFTKHANQK